MFGLVLKNKLMIVFEFSIALISFVTGCIFLWLHRATRQREYRAFSLICFSAFLYTGCLSLLVIHRDNPLIADRYQRLALCGGIMIVPFLVQFVNVIAQRRSKYFLPVLFRVCICLCLMSLFDFHFYNVKWLHYEFTIGQFEIDLRAPGIGYHVFGLAVLISSVYSIAMLGSVYRSGNRFVLPALVGVCLLIIFGVYDTLWAQRVILQPLHPMTEFGLLALVGGMAITLVRSFISSATLLKNLRTRHAQSAKLELQTPQDKFIEQVEAICKSNLHDPGFAAEQFAGEVHMTRAHLNRKLKALTGQTTSRFIRDMRLEHAAQLLKRTSAAITEIAGHAGFDNLSYFNRSFKQRFSVTPSAFRQLVHSEAK